VMRDEGMPPGLESTNFKSEDRAADVVRLRKSSQPLAEARKLATRQAGGCTPGPHSHDFLNTP